MDKDLVTIASYTSLEEAHMARGLLETHGINARVADARVTGAVFGRMVLNPTVHLQVLEHDVDRAQEALDSDQAYGELDIDPDDLP